MKRFFLFAAVNLLVVATISIVMAVFGIRPGISVGGINYQQLMIFCLLWGMGGAFISLQISRWMAKKMMGVKLVDPATRDSELQWLVQTVHRLARSAHLPAMPEVGVYESDDLNAFATGPSKSRSLVAVSSGLLRRMNQEEAEGVLGHEVAHIANGDMVTMTLIQGVVNAFVMFFARIVAFFVAQAFRGNRDEESSQSGGGMNWVIFQVTVFVCDILFSILGSVVIAFFSRSREFRADQGGATLAGKQKMISALKALQRNMGIEPEAKEGDTAFQTLKISSRPKGLYRIFSTHPALEDRIARLSQVG